MNPNKSSFKSPLGWILAAGVLIGAGATASVFSTRGGATTAIPAPSVTVSTPRPVGQINADSLDMVKALDESFANLADSAKPAVVHIRVQNSGSRNAFGERQVVGGEGSGFIFRPDGYIITNDHVAGGFEKVTVILYDGREFPGKVLRAEDSDIAVVKIDADNLPTLPFADSGKVRSGEFAVAIGAPYGFENTVTVGHVSATQRTNEIPDPMSGRTRLYSDLIQTDAAINVGNSGGPLINIEGQVIGINSAIFSPTGTSGGIGFVISSNQARLLAETLIEKGKINRGFLGIRPENLKIAQAKNLGVESGAFVAELPSDGPAAMAGIKERDVVVRIGNLPVENQADLRNAMIKYGPGSKIDVEVIRDRQHKTFTVTAKEPPVQEAQPQNRRLPEGNMDDFPGFKDFPRVEIPDQIPNLPRGVRLGVEVGNVDASNRATHHLPTGTKGAVVNSVTPGSVASEAGLHLGDVIVEFDGKSIASAEDIANAVRSVKRGETKKIKFLRFESGAKVELEREAQF
jgi:serine protease Do